LKARLKGLTRKNTIMNSATNKMLML